VGYLGYDDLKRAIEDRTIEPHERLQVEPYDPNRLRSASLELHLGRTVARWRQRGHVTVSVYPKKLSDISEADFEITRNLEYGDTVLVQPGEALLVAVDCWVGLGAGLIGRVEGKSSIGRAGQLIHTAGFIDPGFVGVLVLEPVNLAPTPVIYTVGDPIAQLTIATLEHPTSRPYGHPEMQSRYQGQSEVTPPRPTFYGSAWDPRLKIPNPE
jgi:dCTP deaminase